MKKDKKISKHQVPQGFQYPGLKALFNKAGLIDQAGNPTAEGKKALEQKESTQK